MADQPLPPPAGGQGGTTPPPPPPQQPLPPSGGMFQPMQPMPPQQMPQGGMQQGGMMPPPQQQQMPQQQQGAMGYPPQYAYPPQGYPQQMSPQQGMYGPPMGGQMGQQQMQGGMMPQGGMPFGQGDAGAPPPPPKPAVPANFQLGALLPQVLKVKIPAHSLKFDEQYFLRLLAGSISLTKDEKMRIVESAPKLAQGQVDELIRIFDEEKRKFAELSEEHVPQLQKLAQQHYEDWIDIEMQFAARDKKTSENQQAEELRKKLGLN